MKTQIEAGQDTESKAPKLRMLSGSRRRDSCSPEFLVDLYALELGPWERRGCLGAYVNLSEQNH